MEKQEIVIEIIDGETCVTYNGSSTRLSSVDLMGFEFEVNGVLIKGINYDAKGMKL